MNIKQVKTTTPNKDLSEQNWHLIDASDQILGKISTEVAKILSGKNKAHYSPNMVTTDKVIVINSDKVKVTGKKETDKLYIHHTGFPGGLRTASYQEVKAKDSTKIIRTAINGMLPKNKLRKVRLANLYIYKGSEHPHQGQINK